MSTTQPGRDPLVAISLAAGVGFTAYAEYQLAVTIGAVPFVAVLLPLALDVYVVAAIRRGRGRDIALSLILMGTAQIAAHVLEAGVLPVSVPLVAAVSLLVPLSIWRVHALAVLPPKPAASTAPEPALTVERVPAPEVPQVPAAVPVPVPPVSRPELEAVPDLTAPPVPPPVPVRQPRRMARKTKVKAGSAPGTGKAGTAAFDEHVRSATAWLAKDPELSGSAIGTKLGTSDRYGRKVKSAATGTTAPGPAPRTGTEPTNTATDSTVGKGTEGYF